jgi:hypothetical protein
MIEPPNETVDDLRYTIETAENQVHACIAFLSRSDFTNCRELPDERYDGNDKRSKRD